MPTLNGLFSAPLIFEKYSPKLKAAPLPNECWRYERLDSQAGQASEDQYHHVVASEVYSLPYGITSSWSPARDIQRCIFPTFDS